ncbi:cas scaffolding protein family member 4 isoform X3 [Vombatus ursinus]|uniref:cas scaffolding protein family member 4 isoform X3 n=1 Tax=Vombatus ursinus TaxID=29139 RepID=UPI000FFD6A44|nr:cas scaffolding protein family member 4 isoform X3 [Vombatus ursinus]
MTNLKGTSIMNKSPEQCILAKALYDNHAECADELAFRRGDILTILEKNVPESEGWWKCSLHGRQGLAPANRLHLLTDAEEGGLSLFSQNSLEELPSSPEKTCHVPSELNRPAPPGVYEQMVGWVKLPQPVASSTDQIYEQPAPLTTAKIFTEKTPTFAKQDLFTLPRPIPTSLSTINSQVYDVPSPQSQGRLIPKEQEQQVYDIPASSEKAGIHVPMSHKTMNLEDVQKPVFKQAEKKKDLKTKSLFPTNHKPLNRQDPEKKINLSEHCRLYFGGLLKAIGIFNTSLSNNQPPEIFITQSKLIIMIGQKLVDSLCQETKEKDVRNEILHSSSQLCGLLKNLAVATKSAVLKYPNDAAMRELQEEAEKLCKHTQQVREMLE